MRTSYQDYRTLHTGEKTLFNFQKSLDEMASLGEKMKNIGTWKNPFATGLLTILMFGATVALYFIPVRWILLGKTWRENDRVVARPGGDGEVAGKRELVLLLACTQEIRRIAIYRCCDS